MAIFVFVFGALCGSIAAILSAMLFDIGVIGALTVFLGASFAMAAVPFVPDIVNASKRKAHR